MRETTPSVVTTPTTPYRIFFVCCIFSSVFIYRVKLSLASFTIWVSNPVQPSSPYFLRFFYK